MKLVFIKYVANVTKSQLVSYVNAHLFKIAHSRSKQCNGIHQKIDPRILWISIESFKWRSIWIGKLIILNPVLCSSSDPPSVKVCFIKYFSVIFLIFELIVFFLIFFSKRADPVGPGCPTALCSGSNGVSEDGSLTCSCVCPSFTSTTHPNAVSLGAEGTHLTNDSQVHIFIFLKAE